MFFIQTRSDLVYTGLFFTTNFITARLYGYITYSVWFYVLTATTILFHGLFPASLMMNAVDKIPIVGIVTTGGYLFVQKTREMEFYDKIQYKIGAVASFLLVLYLFYGGYLQTAYCFDPDEQIANTYHFLIHLVSSIGHHMIIVM